MVLGTKTCSPSAALSFPGGRCLLPHLGRVLGCCEGGGSCGSGHPAATSPGTSPGRPLFLKSKRPQGRAQPRGRSLRTAETGPQEGATSCHMSLLLRDIFVFGWKLPPDLWHLDFTSSTVQLCCSPAPSAPSQAGYLAPCQSSRRSSRAWAAAWPGLLGFLPQVIVCTRSLREGTGAPGCCSPKKDSSQAPLFSGCSNSHQAFLSFHEAQT